MSPKQSTAPDIAPLFDLEQLDLKRRSVQERLKEIPGRKDLLSAELARMDRSLREKEQAAAAKEKSLSALELDLKTIQSQETEKRLKLNSVKTQKEYDALKDEIEAARGDVGKLEERILLLMDEIAEIKNLVKRSKSTTAEEKSKFTQELESLAAAEKNLQDELNTFTQDSESKHRALPDDIRREYDRLRAALPGGHILSKLVSIDGGYSCSACNSPVPHQAVIELKRGMALHRCDICHRLLYP